MPPPRVTQGPERVATPVLIALALAVAAGSGLVRGQHAPNAVGEDLSVICVSGNLLDIPSNPYDHEVLTASGVPAHLVLAFPPLLVQAWTPACAMAPYWLAGLAGIALVFLTWRALEVPFLLAACAIFSGFGAFPWVALTGNFAMLEALAVGVATVSLAANAPLTFGAALGAAAFMKSLTPLPMALSAIRWTPGTAARAVAAVLLTVASLQAIQWIIWPEAAAAYWQAVLTLYPGHAADELRFATEHNPSAYAFLPIATNFLGFGAGAGTWMAVLTSAAFACAWLRTWRRAAGAIGARVWAAMLLMAVIVVAHPRVKPYSLFVLTPVLAYALARMPAAWRAPVIALTCIVPHAAVLLLLLPPLPVYMVFLLQYSQWVALATSVAIALRLRNVLVIAGSGASERPATAG